MKWLNWIPIDKVYEVQCLLVGILEFSWKLFGILPYIESKIIQSIVDNIHIII